MNIKITTVGEPWRLDEVAGDPDNTHRLRIIDADGTVVMSCWAVGEHARDCARRVIALVNAGKGLSTGMLEQVGEDVLPARVRYQLLLQVVIVMEQVLARRFIALGGRGANAAVGHPDRAEWEQLRTLLERVQGVIP